MYETVYWGIHKSDRFEMMFLCKPQNKHDEMLKSAQIRFLQLKLIYYKNWCILQH